MNCVSFNWTKVELKHMNQEDPEKLDVAFNWTKVELKLSLLQNRDEEVNAFNWTKVELKQITEYRWPVDFFFF